MTITAVMGLITYFPGEFSPVDGVRDIIDVGNGVFVEDDDEEEEEEVLDMDVDEGEVGRAGWGLGEERTGLKNDGYRGRLKVDQAGRPITCRMQSRTRLSTTADRKPPPNNGGPSVAVTPAHKIDIAVLRYALVINDAQLACKRCPN